jgi:hypothetical protein
MTSRAVMAIARFEGGCGADLLAMGPEARSGIPGVPIGNTAGATLGQVDGSVPASRPVDPSCPLGDEATRRSPGDRVPPSSPALLPVR